MPNDNPFSRQIIESWFARAMNPPAGYNSFDKMICLWISFNCFFVSEFQQEARGDQKLKKGALSKVIGILKKMGLSKILRSPGLHRMPGERDYLKAVYNDHKCKSIYSELLRENGFREDMKDFKERVRTLTHFRDRVADMRYKTPVKGRSAKFTDIENFRQFIMVAYQIRCNLFHGNKSQFNDDDVRLVEGVFKPLTKFISRVYTEHGYRIN